jgi:hypothetical protein
MATASPMLAADVPTLVDDAKYQNGTSALDSAECTLIDTDYDIDDMMAIPLVIGNRYVAGIITSEGYTLPPDGAAALSRLIAEPGQRHIPIIVGGSSHLSSNDIKAEWGQFVLDYRAMMGRSMALMSSSLPPAMSTQNDYVEKVVDVLADCKSTDILIIGSFTSFVQYSPEIRTKIKNLIIMGKPLRGDESQRPGNFTFNCEYDMSACQQAFDKQLPGLKYFYVDVPRSKRDADPVGHEEIVYGPTLDMVENLEKRGLPNALRQALVGSVRDGSLGASVSGADYWAIDCCFRAGGKSLLWDQTAALFLVYPEVYTKVGGPGGHYEPTVTAEEFRRLWIEATNRSVIYMNSPSEQ